MPGGWTMSMAWVRMPGQSWPVAAASFLGMWVVIRRIGEFCPVCSTIGTNEKAEQVCGAFGRVRRAVGRVCNGSQ